MKNKLKARLGDRWEKLWQARRPLERKMINLFLYVFMVQMLLFQIVVYQFVDRYVLADEKFYTRQVIKDLTTSLAEAENELSLANLAETLYETANSDFLVETPTGYHFLRSERDVTNMLYFNQDIYIYDTQKRLLFTTDEKSERAVFGPVDELVSTEWSGNEGYALTAPILSEVTGDLVGYAQVFHDLTNYNSLMRQIMIYLVAFEVLGVVMAIGAVAFSTRRFLRPMNKLHLVMSQISQKPNELTIRSQLKSGDEIEDLSRIFDSMLDRIEDYSNQQSRFISDVSHELRTPLAVVEGHLNMLRRWGKDDPLILEESLEASHEETKRMTLMIQDMLDLVRLQTNKDQFKGEVADLREVVSAVVTNFSLLHPEATIEQLGQLGQPGISFYRPHLEQVVTILLDNAVKYSQGETYIQVFLFEQAGRPCLSVRDRGVGIGEEELEHIFKRFYRTDQSRTKLTTQGGLGIGLSILSQLAKIYETEIDVQSQPGLGTTFILKFLPA